MTGLGWISTGGHPGGVALLLPTSAAWVTLQRSALIRFSLLALSSIFFLVDPFAALPTFLAVTAGQDPRKRVRTARKASLTALVILTAFAVAGRLIFRLFGITLPAFEIAGGIILLLIGLDMQRLTHEVCCMSPLQQAMH